MKKTQPNTYHGTYASYTAGFILSILLTLMAYLLVVNHTLSGFGLIAGIAGLGVIQLFVQLMFFLHLGSESRPRWNLVVFCFAATVVGILVFGTLWIMNNLNYNHSHLSPAETNSYIIKDEGFKQ